MYYSDGDIYEGQWWNDKPEGEGMLRQSECPAHPAHAHTTTPCSAGHAHPALFLWALPDRPPSSHAQAEPCSSVGSGGQQDQISAPRELIL